MSSLISLGLIIMLESWKFKDIENLPFVWDFDSPFGSDDNIVAPGRNLFVFLSITLPDIDKFGGDTASKVPNNVVDSSNSVVFKLICFVVGVIFLVLVFEA